MFALCINTTIEASSKTPHLGPGQKGQELPAMIDSFALLPRSNPQALKLTVCLVQRSYHIGM